MWQVTQAMHADLGNCAWLWQEQVSRVKQTERQLVMEADTGVYVGTKTIKDCTLISYVIHSFVSLHSVRFTTSWLSSREITAGLGRLGTKPFCFLRCHYSHCLSCYWAKAPKYHPALLSVHFSNLQPSGISTFPDFQGLPSRQDLLSRFPSYF